MYIDCDYLVMIVSIFEKSVLGGIWTESLPIYKPDDLYTIREIRFLNNTQSLGSGIWKISFQFNPS